MTGTDPAFDPETQAFPGPLWLRVRKGARLYDWWADHDPNYKDCCPEDFEEE